MAFWRNPFGLPEPKYPAIVMPKQRASRTIYITPKKQLAQQIAKRPH